MRLGNLAEICQQKGSRWVTGRHLLHRERDFPTPVAYRQEGRHRVLE